MGTNFYLAAPHLAGHYDDPYDPGVHIGKSSAGWKFCWRGHPDFGVTSRADWGRLFRECGDAAIVDEYGRVLTFAEFVDICDDAKRQARRDELAANRGPLLCATSGGGRHDADGCDFCDREFC